ncbi:thioesterase family protein [Rapidithrix thailandica]|uniref:Thioesterase family protein n=1 Tax=Rapidithrix thailandica TaxID=413964 RepID=A0AAW9S748_9BACT
MFLREFQIRVRYADTDQMGYVYYGNYATFYEIGRVESLRSLGFSYKQLEEEGVMMPVLESSSKYLGPARYDELLTIKTVIKELPKVKIRFEYEIFNEAGNLIHTGDTILAFIRKDNHRPCRAPKQILSLLSPYFS